MIMACYHIHIVNGKFSLWDLLIFINFISLSKIFQKI